MLRGTLAWHTTLLCVSPCTQYTAQTLHQYHTGPLLDTPVYNAVCNCTTLCILYHPVYCTIMRTVPPWTLHQLTALHTVHCTVNTVQPYISFCTTPHTPNHTDPCIMTHHPLRCMYQHAQWIKTTLFWCLLYQCTNAPVYQCNILVLLVQTMCSVQPCPELCVVSFTKWIQRLIIECQLCMWCIMYLWLYSRE